MSNLTLSTTSRKIDNDKLAKTISYYAAFIALGLANASLGPTLPGLAENTGTQLREISFLFTGNSLGYLIGSLLGGRLYDSLPGHTIMALMIIGIIITLALVPTVSLLWLLTLILLLMGVSKGALDVGGNTLLVWIHKDNVGPFMNGLHFFFGVGAFLSPILIAQALLYSGGITWAYWLLALLIFPVALMLLRLPSPPIRTTSSDAATEPINYRLVGLIVLFFFLYVGSEVSFGGWVFTYAVTLELADKAVAAYLTSAFWGALTVGRLLAIPITARFRPQTVLLSDLLGCIVSVTLILLSNSLLALWLGTLGLGLSMASVFPTMFSFAERRMAITGQVTSWFFVGASLGGMTLPWLIGQRIETAGPIIVMLAILLDLLVAVGILTVLMLQAAAQEHTEDYQ